MHCIKLGNDCKVVTIDVIDTVFLELNHFLLHGMGRNKRTESLRKKQPEPTGLIGNTRYFVYVYKYIHIYILMPSLNLNIVLSSFSEERA